MYHSHSISLVILSQFNGKGSFVNRMDNKKAHVKEIEKTEIWYGEDKAMEGLVRTMAMVESNADIVGDSLDPSFSMGLDKIVKNAEIKQIDSKFAQRSKN